MLQPERNGERMWLSVCVCIGTISPRLFLSFSDISREQVEKGNYNRAPTAVFSSERNNHFYDCGIISFSVSSVFRPLFRHFYGFVTCYARNQRNHVCAQLKRGKRFFFSHYQQCPNAHTFFKRGKPLEKLNFCP